LCIALQLQINSVE